MFSDTYRPYSVPRFGGCGASVAYPAPFSIVVGPPAGGSHRATARRGYWLGGRTVQLGGLLRLDAGRVASRELEVGMAPRSRSRSETARVPARRRG